MYQPKGDLARTAANSAAASADRRYLLQKTCNESNLFRTTLTIEYTMPIKGDVPTLAEENQRIWAQGELVDRFECNLGSMQHVLGSFGRLSGYVLPRN